jgi:ADP-ribose pyrophosphatase
MTSLDDPQILWQGKVFDFNVEERVLPNGRKVDMGVIRHPGSAAILPVLEDGSVVLIHQYRPVIGDFIWEIPSGTISPEEDPWECARRELREECGLIGKKFEKIGEILVAPWYSDERVHLFIATGITPCEQNLDEDEIITAHIFPFDRAIEMVEQGKIQDATTILGLQFADSVFLRNRIGFK